MTRRARLRHRAKRLVRPRAAVHSARSRPSLSGRNFANLLSSGALRELARLTHSQGVLMPVPAGRHNQPSKKTKPMKSDITRTLKTLNDLIEVLKDGEAGFKSSADDVKVPDLALVFNRYAVQRAEFASELQARVLALGTDVETSGSIAGSIHRGWINLKAALSTNEPRAVLAEAERGEDTAVAAYRKALEQDELDPSTRDLLGRQYADVKAAHDHVKMLRDSNAYRKAS